MMEEDKNIFTQVDRTYKITSKELKEKLKIIGDINSIGLYKGLSTDEKNEGESHDKDVWYIITVDKTDN